MKISVVIPVYNSEECVMPLTQKIAEALCEIEYEQIMVNDFSRDKSWQKICEAIERGFPVVGVNLRKNAGQDNAIFAGLCQACGEWVVIMDDDLQHSPNDIPLLLKKAECGFDCVYANFPKKKQAAWKNFGSFLNGKAAEILISKPRGIYLSPFKILRGDVAKEIASSKTLYPYIDGLIFLATQNITQIPIEHHARAAGKSNYNFWKSLKVFAKLVFGFSVIPLRIASGAGVLSAVAGFSLGVYYFARHFFRPEKIEGWTSLAVLTLFLGGIILLSLGIIGEYLGRSYLTLNASPRFSVSEIKRKK